MTGRKPGTPTMHLVSSPEIAPDVDLAPEDAMAALLLAQQGYQAAVDAADGVTLPSLTDFVD